MIYVITFDVYDTNLIDVNKINKKWQRLIMAPRRFYKGWKCELPKYFIWSFECKLGGYNFCPII